MTTENASLDRKTAQKTGPQFGPSDGHCCQNERHGENRTGRNPSGSLTNWRIINLLCLITALGFFSLKAIAGPVKQECYYNPEVIDYNYFLSNTKFTHAHWNQFKKEAKITLKKEQEEVFVRYVACETFGMSAKLRIKKSAAKLDPAFLLERIKWLGRNTLSDSDYSLMVKEIGTKEFSDDLGDILSKETVFVGMEDTDYQSFEVYVVSDGDYIYIEILWYM